MSRQRSASVLRTTISLDAEISKKAKETAKAQNMKFSNYLERLIEDDLERNAGRGDPMDPEIMIRVTERLSGAIEAKDMRDALAALGVEDQPKLLRHLIQNWLTWAQNLPESEERKVAEYPGLYPNKKKQS
ncbi:MAG: hypothetical protein HRU10_11165 [Opitutales bacterium]|nr:hypothetical protein [Opitutales bacterium]